MTRRNDVGGRGILEGRKSDVSYASRGTETLSMESVAADSQINNEKETPRNDTITTQVIDE